MTSIAVNCNDPEVVRSVEAATATNTRRAYRNDLEHFHAYIPYGQEIKTVGKASIVISQSGLTARRPLRFLVAINGALCGSAGKWGETHGVGRYHGLNDRDRGSGAAATE
jgi:hypothetical protein